MRISTKPEGSKPFDLEVIDIGDRYDLSDLYGIRCRPTEETKEKHKEMVRYYRNILEIQIKKKELKRIKGLKTFVERFYNYGDNGSDEVFVCLQRTTNTDM